MRIKKEEPLAVVKLAWNCVVALPLGEAHQLQRLLINATSYDGRNYDERTRYAYLQEFKVPAVELIDTRERPLFDATMLSNEEAEEWRDIVSKGLQENEGTRARDAVTPEMWQKMKGE